MAENERKTVDLDELARTLANHAGTDWDRLATYPGYARNTWREKAKRVFGLPERGM
ncbi:MAG: hypothetical protein HKN78_11720 [Sphingomonadaceae bacterium]|nr:hypothetical protein [Sphingomonadaceae bacterium]